MKRSDIMYAITGNVEIGDRPNCEILYEDEDLNKVKEVLKLIESIDEFEYYENMKDSKAVEEILSKLFDIGVQWWNDDAYDTDEYLPPISNVSIINYSDVKC